MTRITQAKVMEIHKAKDLSGYSHAELRACDEWLKAYALKQLANTLQRKPLAPMAKTIIEYILLMARCHFGSVETDRFLTELNCYPKWTDENAQ